MEAYENTLEDTMNSVGIYPGFFKDFPRIIHAVDRSSRKNGLLEEIDMEKANYLLCVDDMLEEMLSRG